MRPLTANTAQMLRLRKCATWPNMELSTFGSSNPSATTCLLFRLRIM